MSDTLKEDGTVFKSEKSTKAQKATEPTTAVVFVNTGEPLYPSKTPPKVFATAYESKQQVRISEVTKANRRAAARQYYARRNGG